MELQENGRRRVVVTGLGALTPLGDVRLLWQGLLAGRSGIGRIKSFDAGHLSTQIAGEIKFVPIDCLDRKEARRMARASQLALIAAKMALEDSGLEHHQLEANSDRVAVVMGTGEGGYEIAAQTSLEFRTLGRRPSPFALANSSPNMPGFYISREMHATGPLMTIVSACASSTHSIGEAAEIIRNGRADIVFTGGVEALIQDYVIASLDSMGVLASGYNDRPEAASRPFDADRCGFIPSEGAAILILETLEHARKRSARIYAEILGHAESSDAFHIAAPDPEGKGAQKAMRWALDDARLNPAEIDYINAHGTSTKLNDAVETFAIKQVFGEGAYTIPISSTKSMLGHAIGGSGAIEAISSILSLRYKVIHPTINYDRVDPECDLDYVPNEAREADIQTALSNSFGFGGQNACLVFRSI